MSRILCNTIRSRRAVSYVDESRSFWIADVISHGATLVSFASKPDGNDLLQTALFSCTQHRSCLAIAKDKIHYVIHGILLNLFILLPIFGTFALRRSAIRQSTIVPD